MSIDLIQTIAIVISVLVAAISIGFAWKQAQISERQAQISEEQSRIAVEAIKVGAYDTVQTDYSSLARMMLENPHLRHLFGSACEIVRPRWNGYSDEQKDLYLYITSVYDILDRVYRLRDRQWLPEGEWEAWNEWLIEAVDYEMFEQVHEDSRGQYPAKLMQFIDDTIATKRQASEAVAGSTNGHR